MIFCIVFCNCICLKRVESVIFLRTENSNDSWWLFSSLLKSWQRWKFFAVVMISLWNSKATAGVFITFMSVRRSFLVWQSLTTWLASALYAFLQSSTEKLCCDISFSYLAELEILEYAISVVENSFLCAFW